MAEVAVDMKLVRTPLIGTALIVLAAFTLNVVTEDCNRALSLAEEAGTSMLGLLLWTAVCELDACEVDTVGCTFKVGVSVRVEPAMLESVPTGEGVESDCPDAEVSTTSESVPCAVLLGAIAENGVDMGVEITLRVAVLKSVSIAKGAESDCSDAEIGTTSELVPCAVLGAIAEVGVGVGVELPLRLASGSPICAEDDCWFRSDDSGKVADGIDKESVVTLDIEAHDPLLVASGKVSCAEPDCNTEVAEGNCGVSVRKLDKEAIGLLLVATGTIPCAELDDPSGDDEATRVAEGS